jgi:16S rRNA (guanine(966)-N(2))-methyltransferase RsmD
MLKITGGTLRGKLIRLPVPEGVRPTSSRTREAVFSMVGQDLSGWGMLDLFGGSGLMALEAFSRGASPVTVVEQSLATVRFLKAVVQELAVPIRVIEGDALRLALNPAELVFADPPYRLPLENWLPVAAKLAEKLLVAEACAGTVWPATIGPLALDRVRTYGEASIGIFSHP